jgi:hypothetical protein
MSAKCQKWTFTSSAPPGKRERHTFLPLLSRQLAHSGRPALRTPSTYFSNSSDRKVHKHLQSWRSAALDRSGAGEPSSAQRALAPSSARPLSERYTSVHAGFFGGDAGCPPYQRFRCRSYASASRLFEVCTRPHSDYGFRRTAAKCVRVLLHRQQVLRHVAGQLTQEVKVF